MKLTDQQGGFTIVETLIVLAITSLLFFLAFSNMLAYLRHNSFNTAVNDLQQQVQSVINKSSNGQYSTFNGSSGFSCTPHNGSPPTITLLASDTQGSNLGCQFIGTALRLGVDAGGTNNAQESMTFYPLVINECTNGSVPPCTETLTNLSGPNNQVTALSPNLSTAPIGTSYDFENGLKLQDVKQYGTSTPIPQTTNPITSTVAPVFGYAFSNLGASVSGSAGYSLYPFTPGGSGNMAMFFNGGTLTSAALGSLNRVVLCVAIGNQYATVTIGDAQSVGGLGVSTQVLSSSGVPPC